MYLRKVIFNLVFISTVFLAGCESAEEIRERQGAEMKLAYESCISNGGAKRPCAIQADGCTAVTGDINC